MFWNNIFLNLSTPEFEAKEGEVLPIGTKMGGLKIDIDLGLIYYVSFDRARNVLLQLSLGLHYLPLRLENNKTPQHLLQSPPEKSILLILQIKMRSLPGDMRYSTHLTNPQTKHTQCK